MVWRFAALPIILLLPGYLTLHLPVWGEESGLQRALGQCLFLSLLTSVLIAGFLGLVLAQAGLFSLVSLLLALGAYLACCLAFITAKGADSPFSVTSIHVGREEAMIMLLHCLSLVLYAKPAEYILGWLDAGWYVNTGVHIAKTGSLTGENQILSSLPPAAKPLFYNSFAALREMFPYFPNRRCSCH